MAILKFNGTDVSPEPSEMSVTIQDISTADSGRASNGYMNKIVVARKRSIPVSWNNIKQADAYGIIKLLKGPNFNRTYVSVTYDGDPEATGVQTRDFYYGDISGAFQQCWTGSGKRYSKLSFNLVER